MEPRALTVHIYDFMTGTYQTTVPFSSLSFGDTLNGSTAFSGTVNMTDPAVRNTMAPQLIVPGKSLAVVDLAGTPIGVYMLGMPKRRHMDPQSLNMQLTGQSLWWWFTRRVQAADYSSPPYSSISGPSTPMTYWSRTPYGADMIAGQVLADAVAYGQYGQTLTGTDPLGGMGVYINGVAIASASEGVPSGDWTEMSFPYASLATLDSILQQLTGLGYGIGVDISIDVAYSAGVFSPLTGKINIWYPRKGQTAAANHLYIDGSRTRKYDIDEDCSSQGTTTYETGVTGTLEVVDNVNPISQGWPLLEQVNSQSYLSGPNAVTNLAKIGAEDNYLSSFPVFSGSITLPLWGSDPAFGGFVVGDGAILWLPADENFPDGLQEELRIAGWQVDAPEEGDQTVTLTLQAPPSATAATGPLP